MNLKLILNAALPDYAEQCGMLGGLLEKATGLPEPEAWVFCQKEYLSADWMDSIPASQIVLLEMEEVCVEGVLAVLTERLQRDTLVLLPENYFGSELATRLAFRMNGCAQNAVQTVAYDSEQITVQRSVYGGHMLGSFRLKQQPFCLTASRNMEGDIPAQPRQVIETVRCQTEKNPAVIPISYEPEPPTEGLKNAPFVLAVGRGVKNHKEMEKIRQFAETIGAGLGCSRPVVMSALAPMEQLIGVSGTMTRPDCCITLGVSGAPAFYAGIEKSKLLISVNQDEAASIHKKSDASVVGDLWEFVEEMTKQLSEAD